MKIKIVFDNTAPDKNFTAGWGFSCLIDDKILFDTGEKSSSLFSNMKSMGIKITDLETIVISHDHWDHTGGLWDILIENHKVKVYGCPGFSRQFKNKVQFYKTQLIEADKFTQISEDIYTTGEIEGKYGLNKIAEQSMVIKTEKGLTIITGCAHPGIIKIIENVKMNIIGDIYLVMGGFHLQGNSADEIISIIENFKKFNITMAGPCHCSGTEALQLFRKEYGDNFIKIKAGMTIEV